VKKDDGDRPFSFCIQGRTNSLGFPLNGITFDRNCFKRIILIKDENGTPSSLSSETGGNFMAALKFRSLLLSFMPVVFAGFFTTTSAITEQFRAESDKKIDSLRKGDITICVKDPAPVSNAQITVKQLKHHFAFGAALPWSPLKKDSAAAYARTFLKYFEWATPENEMKWAYNEPSDSCGNFLEMNFSDADSLVNWCRRNGLKVRGHNLFWNEKPDWQPGWVKCLDTADFRAAMKQRIDSAMTHFKGRVENWDIINEIVHGPTGQVEIPGYYAKHTGDTSIFSWIFKNARAIDPTVKMAVNEFCIIEKCSALRDYVNMTNKIEHEGGKIDIVGLEGHFGADMNRLDYTRKIDSVAEATNHKEIWLTEVDFAVTVNMEDSLEEVMRTAFSHKDIGGLMLWMWWEGNRWRSYYTSCLVDSGFRELPLGARWRKMKDSLWTTTTSGGTNASGEYKFRGFYGIYEVTTVNGAATRKDTVNFRPDSALTFNVPKVSGVLRRMNTGFEAKTVLFNGKRVAIKVIGNQSQPLFLSTYSLSGKVLNKAPITFTASVGICTEIPTGCYVYRIGTENETYYVDKGLNLRR
jgi:GH35 family endo-1,4-beta-xylanase